MYNDPILTELILEQNPELWEDIDELIKQGYSEEQAIEAVLYDFNHNPYEKGGFYL